VKIVGVLIADLSRGIDVEVLLEIMAGKTARESFGGRRKDMAGGEKIWREEKRYGGRIKIFGGRMKSMAGG